MACYPGTQSAYCKESNLVSSKFGAQILLRGILGLPIDEDAIPAPAFPGMPSTIVEAAPVREVQGIEVEPCEDDR